MTIASTETLDARSLQALLGAQLTADQATRILEQGKDAVVFALLNLAKQLAETQTTPSAAPDPSAPSGQTPPYVKPTAKGRNKPKGATPGHPGRRRPTPERIDQREEHTLAACRIAMMGCDNWAAPVDFPLTTTRDTAAGRGTDPGGVRGLVGRAVASGAAEEPAGQGNRLRPEPVAGPADLYPRRGAEHRQQPRRADAACPGKWKKELFICWERSGRPHCGDPLQRRRQLQAARR